LPITTGRRLRTVVGTVSDLTADPTQYGDDYLRVWLRQATYAGMREELLEALPNALEIRIDPQFSSSPHQNSARTHHSTKTPAELFAEYCAFANADDPRVSQLFDELHDELTSAPGRR
jgi:DNA repair protein SbcD/Mre11